MKRLVEQVKSEGVDFDYDNLAFYFNKNSKIIQKIKDPRSLLLKDVMKSPYFIFAQ